MKFERQSLIFKQNEVLIILCLVNKVYAMVLLT